MEATNSRELEALAGEVQQFQAQDSDPQMEKVLDTMCPVGKTVELKVGAQVGRLKKLSSSLLIVQNV